MTDRYITRSACASCGHQPLVPILDLGMMPLANAFVCEKDRTNKEPHFPLRVVFCEQCVLLQLQDVINPENLFRKYEYLTSASAPLIQHFENLGVSVADEFIHSPDDLIIDIGGNDGTLLRAIKDRCRILNVDPAENIEPFATQKGVPTLTRFFSDSCASHIVAQYGSPRVVIATNVLAHIADIRDAFVGISRLIGDTGVCVMEVHWVGNLIGEGGFDQIYHEHLYYYSLTSLRNLIRSVGLDVFRVELIPIHGQSMRVFLGKNISPELSVQQLLDRERSLRLDSPVPFKSFKNKVEQARTVLLGLLGDIKRQGKRIVAYGAPAKGNTLLNYFGLTTEIVEYAIDTTPLKQGMFTPGTLIPVYSPEYALKFPPDYYLLLAWNFANTIMEKERAFRDRGGKFIIPVPLPKIV